MFPLPPMQLGDGNDEVRLVLLIVSIASAIVYFIMNERDQFPGRTLIKCLGVGCLSVFAAISLPEGAGAVGMWLVAGLILSTFGDMFLSLDRDRLFVAGLGSFLMAHIAYTIAFFGLVPMPFEPNIQEIAGSALIALAGGALFVWFSSNLGRLMVPVAFYHLAIAVMAIAAVLADLDGTWVLAGALFFMLSDAMIAIEKFKKPFPGVGHGIWSTYYFAQYLICFGMLDQLAS